MSITRPRVAKINNEENNQENLLYKEEMREIQDNELVNCKPFFDFFMENSYYFIYNSGRYIYIAIKFTIQISGIYIMWIVLHFAAAHLYTTLCVPNNIIGLFMSPFLTATPHCQGLRWIIYNAANVINNMWLVLGAWICSTLLVINRDSPNDK
jgi:hypothetical protein